MNFILQAIGVPFQYILGFFSSITGSYTIAIIIFTVLVNLAPRKLRGVESQGMILMTENAEGKLVFLNPGEDGVENGATIN